MSIDEDPDQWITEHESLIAQLDDAKISAHMTNEYFLVHILNDLPEEYDSPWCLQSRLFKSGPQDLRIEDTWDMLRDCFEVIKGKSKKVEKEKALLTKVIEDAQNAKLSNEHALAVFKRVQRNM